MAKKRDYAAIQRRREQRARELGFSGYAEQRRVRRQVDATMRKPSIISRSRKGIFSRKRVPPLARKPGVSYADWIRAKDIMAVALKQAPSEQRTANVTEAAKLLKISRRRLYPLLYM